MNHRDDKTAVSILVCFACISLALLLLAGKACEARASAQDSPADTVSASPVGGFSETRSAENVDGAGDVLTVAQVCFLEATYRRPDCAAMAGTNGVARVLAKRRGTHWVDELRAYSALDKGSPRANRVKLATLTVGPDGVSAKWSAHVEYVREVVAGNVPSPCRGADGWGSPYINADIIRAQRALASRRWAIARCAEPTANLFFRSVRP